jgi:hypothetical protein
VSRIVIVPGLAVRSYARPPALAARRAGHDVSLLRPPAWRGAPADLAEYGVRLAEQLETRDERVDVLVGLSVGTQAAAVAATRTDRIRRLLLVSPTVDPRHRSMVGLVSRWLGGDPQDDAPPPPSQLADWARAGVPRIAAGYLSALRVPLERVLPHIRADLVVVHVEHDSLGTAAWAAELAEVGGGRLIELADAPHSWPVGDPDGFVRMIGDLT